MEKALKTFILACLSFVGLAYGQGMVLPPIYKQCPEPAFEKIYIESCQLVMMPDGLYYFDDEGGSTRVKTVLSDYDGMYILKVKHQCPLCGRCFESSLREEEFGCPIFQRQVHPRIWSE
jgi:hypothetical protein